MTQFSDSHFEDLRAIVRRAAETEILPRFRGLAEGDVGTKKSARDVVTQADILAEEQMTAELKALYPTALVFGEEAHAKDPTVLDGVESVELAFVIDPVDGTLNFVKGLPLFGTILSVVSKGECVGGLLHDPLNNCWLMASKGAGAYRLDGAGSAQPVRTATASSLSEMSGAMCLPFFPEPHRAEVLSRVSQLEVFLAFNCSIFDYWLTATGGTHFTANFCGMYWDHLAGMLIHSEAGGYNARFDRSPYRAFGEPANVLSAPDKESWELIRREILGLSD